MPEQGTHVEARLIARAASRVPGRVGRSCHTCNRPGAFSRRYLSNSRGTYSQKTDRAFTT
jgi:hypothetical protein